MVVLYCKSTIESKFDRYDKFLVCNRDHSQLGNHSIGHSRSEKLAS